ncbi:MAG: hypothetical protein E3J36_03100 [Candidatus Nealsonbacteria bacterium]|nr:MAG: hypothetical protein E3J36_03100 [Candidatus Nealsonbacteria bacterium]
MKTINRRNITTGEIFHILNRGVDKRNIFLDDQDYFRFVHNLFEFNDPSPVFNLGYFLNRNQSIDLRSQYIERKPRKLIIEILAFCLMPNHFHLLIRQKEGGGITKFMRKLGIGYAKYFNQKYQRTGALFQGRYKAVLVNRGAHFIHLPYYIHFNPLDLLIPDWRIGKIKSCKKAIDFLNSYRWSSHLDYLDKKNFPSVTQREFLLKIFGEPKNYKKEVTNWLKEMNLTEIKRLTLE